MGEDRAGLSVGQRGRVGRLIVALAMSLAALAVSASAASAMSQDEALFRIGSGFGGGAGQLAITEGIASDPATGHVYVAGVDAHNRIDEFTPWGNSSSPSAGT